MGKTAAPIVQKTSRDARDFSQAPTTFCGFLHALHRAQLIFAYLSPEWPRECSSLGGFCVGC